MLWVALWTTVAEHENLNLPSLRNTIPCVLTGYEVVSVSSALVKGIGPLAVAAAAPRSSAGLTPPAPGAAGASVPTGGSPGTRIGSPAGLVDPSLVDLGPRGWGLTSNGAARRLCPGVPYDAIRFPPL